MTPGRRSSCLAIGLLVLFLTGCGGASSKGGGSAKPIQSAELAVAPVYSSVNHVLHLRVRASTATSTIAGVLYRKMDIYDTSVVDGQGRFAPGTTSSYVGAQWSVMPGDTMIIDYINGLGPATFTPNGQPIGMIPQPLNLHTHGLTVSPSGNSDNVLMSIPQGRSNRFVIKIPSTQYHGLYWYHPHIHGITDEQVYNGLAGHIVVGRADGDYRQFNGLRVSPMMIRYNVLEPGADGELLDASPIKTNGTALLPKGLMIYTVNGQLRPRIKIRAARPGRPAESQVWAMTNITGSASYIVSLDEVAAKDATKVNVKGRPVGFTIVSEDGTPMPHPKRLSEPARGYLLGQGARVAILVQGASDPSKVVRLLQVENRSGTGDRSAYAYPTPGYIGGWRDYTRDVLATTQDDPTATEGHVATPAVLSTNYKTHSGLLDHARIAHRRTFIFDSVAKPSPTTPNEFPVNDGLFPYSRVDQPKVGTVEEWTLLNYSSLHHPFHVHTQDAQVMSAVSPLSPRYHNPPDDYPSVQNVTDLSQRGPAQWTQDIVNVPPAEVDSNGNPLLGANGLPSNPGKVVVRLRFNYLGEYVEHCHRLPHEDRGMMSLVRAIPNDPVYAVTSTSPAGPEVTVYRSSTNTIVRRIRPFGRAAASLSTAIGNVDGDAIPDLAVASGAGMHSTVRIYTGASGFTAQLAALHPFAGASASAGASVALGDLNGDGRDDIVTGSAAAGPARVAIFDGETHHRLTDFAPESSRGPVSVATGIIEEGGRTSLVTGSGPGGPPIVHVYNFDLFGDVNGVFPDVRSHLAELDVTKNFNGADARYAGGVSVATANPYAATGGFSNVVVTPRSGHANPRIFTIHQTDMMGQIDVSASGVMRPHDYEPVAPRSAMSAPEIRNVGAHGPLEVSQLSTFTGAQLLTIPRAGGHLSLWSAAKIPGTTNYRWRVKRLVTQGTGIAGI
ncbi:MAG: hypothetical protein QOH12_2809 [Solirubrobacteraceae bacterium]|jgi:FtsP/CotA-like multicopper oxidase with cupredoxin domain|nr:hypothetical protein [Solirubrobacteraceae bacterium]